MPELKPVYTIKELAKKYNVSVSDILSLLISKNIKYIIYNDTIYVPSDQISKIEFYLAF